jgi:hypothetical protein
VIVVPTHCPLGSAHVKRLEEVCVGILIN